MTDQRPYASLFAKGEDRRQRILAATQKLVTRHGWRGVTLGQIARAAGVSPAGLLHHFESKEQLLHAALDARDTYDDAQVDVSTDLVDQLQRVQKRFQEAPELVGMFGVLLMENLDPEAPLHDRLTGRYAAARESVAERIREGQRAGIYRTDLDPAVKAVEIVAFITGMETAWLLDPSIPLAEVFREYTGSLVRQLSRPDEAS